MSQSYKWEPETAIAVRTLLAAGYTISETHRQPRHIEFACQHDDVLGASIDYLIALTDENSLTEDEVEDINRSAESLRRIPVIVAREPGDHWISWTDFVEALGGAVPSWQALSPAYHDALLAASRNVLPVGEEGEAWLIFEDLVAAGLEFVFGRRVRRLGGRKRGQPVSDMQAQVPQGNIVVIDAKATNSGFDATWSSLRPLVEYVKRQQQRQQGHLDIIAALIVSSGFQQDEERLQELSRQFYGETRVVVTFLDSTTLGQIVDMFRGNIALRNAIRWYSLLVGGSVSLEQVANELASAHSERIARGE